MWMGQSLASNVLDVSEAAVVPMDSSEQNQSSCVSESHTREGVDS